MPVIRVDGHLSVCVFDVCRQPEHDLSCFRLLKHESFEVWRNGCPVCPVKEHSRRYNFRDYQVRESISCFGFRHDQYLTSSRLVSTSALNEESVE